MNTSTQSDSSQRKHPTGVLTLTAIAVLAVGFFAYHFLDSSTGQTTQPETITTNSTPDPMFAEQATSDSAAKPASVANTQAEHSTATPDTSINNTTTATQTDVIDDDAPTATNIARENQAIQTQYLREALPGNEMVPFERTPEEAEALMAEFQEHNELRQKIESGEATEEDQLRFYELRASKLEDEIELIKLCQDVQANALDAGEETAPTLCQNASANGEQRLQELQEMLAELEKKYL